MLARIWVKSLQREKMFHRILINYLCLLDLPKLFIPVITQVFNLEIRKSKFKLNQLKS
jgi:hypothetical protein